MIKPDHATRAQITASDPTASTWLGANAGSGKTKVLTDRVARLLLMGVPPQRILCLTYTKAAASEMQNRLFKRLGAWAMLDDKSLEQSLSELGVALVEDKGRARTLFARAIDTPGGLKIQTIHSFCAALLRQFPLEAGVSPQFRELDERGQSRVLETVLDDLAGQKPSVLESLARHYSGESFADLAASVAGASESFLATDTGSLPRNLGIEDGQSLETIYEDMVSPEDEEFLMSLAPLLKEAPKPTDKTLGRELAGLDGAPNSLKFDILAKSLLFGAGAAKPFGAKIGRLPTADLRKGPFAEYAPRFEDIMKRVEDGHGLRLRYEAAVKSQCLLDFAHHFLPAYERAKAERGVLDFDDLIHRARNLLDNVDMTWILFKLDGGIDHVLVDEAQDTSPAQWKVVEALTAEMTSGQGARTDIERTLFVVGDKKQSIYSFQGADAEGFDSMRDVFGKKLELGAGLKSAALTHSFRSAPAILKAVDCVFEGAAADGLGDLLEHKAFHENMPGRVDLWDLETPMDQDEPPPWYDPVDRPSRHSPRVRLARKIATRIDGLLKTGTLEDESGSARRIRGGDILVLVRGRGALFDAIIQACKSRNLPMAGTDRLRISAELAVRDILALLSFTALPDDDLSLATSLRSPLFGWSESDLYDLAHNRLDGVKLWQELRDRRAEFPDTFERLTEIRRRADFLRPFELIELILTRLHGRSALVARLGSEAEDGINELLNQALVYEQTEVPSLTGFLAFSNSEDISIKRQVDSQGDLIRVMTVHGAKGLEAPIVILPDTIHGKRRDRAPFVISPEAGPLWNMSRERAPEIVLTAKKQAEKAAADEENRLLYVAMTRAASWLVVAGARGESEPKESWWDTVHDGLLRAGAKRTSDGDEDVLRLESGVWPTEITEHKDPSTPTSIANVELAPSVRAEKQPAPMLSPSSLGGDKVLEGRADADMFDDAKSRGSVIHRLLEVLPGLSREMWPEAAQAHLDPERDDKQRILDEVAKVVDAAPDVFAPATLAEVELAASVPGRDAHIFGAADRVVVDDHEVRIVDFKSNAEVPSHAEETPEGLLRQMGAYLVAAEQIWPMHDVTLEIIWTRTASRMVLPHAIVREAFKRTPIS